MEIEEIIIIETIIDPIIETNQEADGTIIAQVIGVTITRLTIAEVTLDQITDKIFSRHLGTEVKAGIELETITMITQEVEVEIDIMTDLFSLMEEMNLDPGPTPG